MPVKEIRGAAVRGAGNPIYAKVYDQDGTSLVQADVLAVSYSVFGLTAGAAAQVDGYEDVPLVVADVIFNTLQNTPGTVKQHNFRHVVPAAAISDETMSVFQVEYKITLASGEPLLLPCKLSMTKTFTGTL